jgi:hypothetical protein
MRWQDINPTAFLDDPWRVREERSRAPCLPERDRAQGPGRCAPRRRRGVGLPEVANGRLQTRWPARSLANRQIRLRGVPRTPSLVVDGDATVGQPIDRISPDQRTDSLRKLNDFPTDSARSRSAARTTEGPRAKQGFGRSIGIARDGCVTANLSEERLKHCLNVVALMMALTSTVIGQEPSARPAQGTPSAKSPSADAVFKRTAQWMGSLRWNTVGSRRRTAPPPRSSNSANEW